MPSQKTASLLLCLCLVQALHVNSQKWPKRVRVERFKALITNKLPWNQKLFPMKTTGFSNRGAVSWGRSAHSRLRFNERGVFASPCTSPPPCRNALSMASDFPHLHTHFAVEGGIGFPCRKIFIDGSSTPNWQVIAGASWQLRRTGDSWVCQSIVSAAPVPESDLSLPSCVLCHGHLGKHSVQSKCALGTTGG